MSDSTRQSRGYEPQAIEPKWYARWKQSGFFHTLPDHTRKPFCITIPPPNITGSLHIGHALNNTILDVMTRWKRMNGYAVLCLPGTDHAGIATQNVVERELAKEGVTRQELGREKFIQRCFQWRKQYGKRIYYQFEKLGCSFDWERVRFTLDDSYVDAIMEQFRSWYERGLIYRGTRVVNWDVKFQSAISDIEVVTEERQGKLYHFRYPFADNDGYITIATTRPETMLGDAAVAANPDDERYKPLFGRMLKLPLTDREIPLISDEYAKQEFGSGAVKVTPAHDLNDFECGIRHNLPQRVVIGKDGRMTLEAGQDFAGLDRYEAREKVIVQMMNLGLLEKIEEYTIQIPVSDRSGEVIEPLLSEQWFVNMKSLAEPAIQAVKQGKIRFFPERYSDIYLRWMENIRDWCISRQLWWGHRIPIWRELKEGEAMHAFARTREEAVLALGTENVEQDEDVLDTWFSSALWPQATLGWPNATDDLEYFYPTDLLSTAQEILYLWVARMIMTGLDFIHRSADQTIEEDGLLLKDGKTRAIIPFREVYIHATVLDENGERMSKSKGNGIDPIELIERYGADATRFSLLQQAGKNQDIRYSSQRTETAAAFCNKLWNAGRFVIMNMDDQTNGKLPPKERWTQEDRWIISRFQETASSVNSTLKIYEMDDAMRAIYQFFWNDFCDWYLEMSKVRLRSEDIQEQNDIRNLLAYILESLLRLMHPMMPFITEELWQTVPHKGETICLSSYPQGDDALLDKPASETVEQVIDVVRTIRSLRKEGGLAPGNRPAAGAICTDTASRTALESSSALIIHLARLSSFRIYNQSDSGLESRLSSPVKGGEAFLEIGDTIDIEKELSRISAELEAVLKQISRSEGMLNNAAFVERAREEVVEKERKTLAEWQEKRQLLIARMDKLKR